MTADELKEIEAMLAKYNLKVEDITCHKCADKDTCEFAYDPYNTQGDCLWIK